MVGCGDVAKRLSGIAINQIPNSKLVILSKYKHSLLLEAPEIVAENIIKFIMHYFSLR